MNTKYLIITAISVSTLFLTLPKSVKADIPNGQFVSDQEWVYFKNIQLRKWGTTEYQFLTHASYTTSGKQPIDISMNCSDLRCAGDGHMTVRYTNGRSCQFPVSASIEVGQPDIGNYYVKGKIPSHIPALKNGKCPILLPRDFIYTAEPFFYRLESMQEALAELKQASSLLELDEAARKIPGVTMTAFGADCLNKPDAKITVSLYPRERIKTVAHALPNETLALICFEESSQPLETVELQ